MGLDQLYGVLWSEEESIKYTVQEGRVGRWEGRKTEAVNNEKQNKIRIRE